MTVIEAGPCPVVQVKTPDDAGYAAVQLGFGAQKDKNASKAERGHAAKANLEHAPELLKEFKVEDASAYQVGQQLTVEQFQPGDRIKIVGKTKGRGFQGVVKRHGFHGRPGSHGHPKARNPGTLGPGTNPSRVIKLLAHLDAEGIRMRELRIGDDNLGKARQVLPRDRLQADAVSENPTPPHSLGQETQGLR